MSSHIIYTNFLLMVGRFFIYIKQVGVYPLQEVVPPLEPVVGITIDSTKVRIINDIHK
jgi:hypothetical protein